MQGFGYNLRRPLFQDPRVRQALGYGFDFEWSNKNLFYGAYKRTRSYFDNSELAATGVPQGEELKILEPYRGKIPDEVFTKEYNPPKYDGSGNIRDGLREAMKLLKEAGWSFKNEQARQRQDRPALRIRDPAGATRDRAHRAALRAESRTHGDHRAGPHGRRQPIRKADGDVRLRHGRRGRSDSRCRRATSSANIGDRKPPTRRAAATCSGIKSPVIDELVEEVIKAPDREALVAHTRALDRVLQYGYYVIPNYHTGVSRVAYWDKFRRPKSRRNTASASNLVGRPESRADDRGEEGRGREERREVVSPSPSAGTDQPTRKCAAGPLDVGVCRFLC